MHAAARPFVSLVPGQTGPNVSRAPVRPVRTRSSSTSKTPCQPAEKDAARAALAAWVSPANPVIVRVNSADTPWHAADLELCKAPGVAGMVLPKAEFIGE